MFGALAGRRLAGRYPVVPACPRRWLHQPRDRPQPARRFPLAGGATARSLFAILPKLANSPTPAFRWHGTSTAALRPASGARYQLFARLLNALEPICVVLPASRIWRVARLGTIRSLRPRIFRPHQFLRYTGCRARVVSLGYCPLGGGICDPAGLPPGRSTLTPQKSHILQLHGLKALPTATFHNVRYQT